VALVVAGTLAASSLWSQPRFNVLLITLDTTRADHLGCYGYEDALTPALDGLAKRGVLFERTYTSAPLTLPAHTSMFTGLYPLEHGLRTNGKHRLSGDIPTLSEVFLAKGYDTGAFVASFVLHSKFGLNRGFQTYDDDLTGSEPTDAALHRSRDGNIVVDRALAWLQGRVRKPFFCWVHLYDPHAPYLDHRDRFGDRFAERPYDAEVAFVDVQIDRLLKFLQTERLDERTIVVVIGDHGEGLLQHQERRHGQMLYNSTLHVPWIISCPGTLPENQRIATPVSVADVYPTLIEALKLKGASRISGRSVMPAIRGKKLASRGLYAETNEPYLESGWSPLRCLISDNWKYIHTPRVELYDLAQDPEETKNLAAEQDEQLRRLERRLTDLESGLQLREGGVLQLSAADRQKLAGLGYVGHAGKSDVFAVDPKLHDIKDMIGAFDSLEDARTLLEAGKFSEAERQFRQLVDEYPDFELAEISLGDVYLRQSKLDEAFAVYERVLKRNPDSALAMLHSGEVCEAQGRYPEALQHYLDALQYQPDFAKLNYNIGRVLVLLERNDEAISYFKTVLELDPGYVFAHIELGTSLARKGMLDSALAAYEQALKYDSRSVFAHMNAARVLAQQGRSADALQHLEQSAKIAPEDVEIRFQLGAFLAAQGRVEPARTELEAVLSLQPEHAAAKQLLDQLR